MDLVLETPRPAAARALAANQDSDLCLQVKRLVQDAVEGTIGDSRFDREKVPAWTNRIIEECIKQLATLAHPLKYVVSVTLGQKAGAGMHVTSATAWDDATDGKVGVHWTNVGIIALVVVYWCAM